METQSNILEEIKTFSDIVDRPGFAALMRILAIEIKQTTDALLMKVTTEDVTAQNLAFLRALKKVEVFLEEIAADARKRKEEETEFETHLPKVFDISKIN